MADALDLAYGAEQPASAPLHGDPLDLAYGDDTGKGKVDFRTRQWYDPLHEMASSAYHSIVGGYQGLGTLIATRDPDLAAKTVDEETAKTYRAPEVKPETTFDKYYKGPDTFGAIDTSELASTVADKISDPATAALVKGAITVAPYAIRGAGESAPKAKPLPSAEEVVGRMASGQSMGAAGAIPALVDVSPELRQAISQASQKTGGAVNPTALERHIDTEQLPLPEGSEPLRLRKGQALNDEQQKSDEKNLRADPDTQRILERSITDQDQKLVASMGEIRRRATPDIVQRNNMEHGQANIDAIKQADNDRVLDIRSKYKALTDANGGTVPIDPGSFVNNVDDQLAKKFLTKTASETPEVSEILDSMRARAPMDFESFEAARTRLAEAQRRGGSAATAAGIVRNELEALPLSPQAQHLKGLADTARAAAKQRFDIIEQNPAYKAAVNDNVPKDDNNLHVIGADSPLADSFMNRYYLGEGGSASRASVQRIKNVINTPDFNASIEAAALNKLRDSAGIDALGNGSFKNASFRNAVNAMTPKADALLSPQSIENVERLKRVSGYVNDEGKANSTNRSNTALTLQRFGAPSISSPTVIRELANYGVDLGAKHVPGGSLIKNIGQSALSRANDAKELQAIRDAKLKFAIDATKPGAGLEQLESK